jgi:hypothetical protein
MELDKDEFLLEFKSHGAAKAALTALMNSQLFIARFPSKTDVDDLKRRAAGEPSPQAQKESQDEDQSNI